MTEQLELGMANSVPILDEQGRFIGVGTIDPGTGGLRINITDAEAAQKIKDGVQPTISYTALRSGELVNQLTMYLLGDR